MIGSTKERSNEMSSHKIDTPVSMFRSRLMVGGALEQITSEPNSFRTQSIYRLLSGRHIILRLESIDEKRLCTLTGFDMEDMLVLLYMPRVLQPVTLPSAQGVETSSELFVSTVLAGEDSDEEYIVGVYTSKGKAIDACINVLQDGGRKWKVGYVGYSYNSGSVEGVLPDEFRVYEIGVDCLPDRFEPCTTGESDDH